MKIFTILHTHLNRILNPFLQASSNSARLSPYLRKPHQ